MRTSTRVLALVVCHALVTGGCRPAIDTDRDPVDNGTFGQTVVTLMCQRVAYLEDLHDGDGKVDVRGDTFRDICRLGLAPPADAPDPLKALLAKYEDLAAATDTIFPDTFLDTLQAFLTSQNFLDIYDSDKATAAVDALIGLFKLFADDDDVINALERLNLRIGYRPLTPGMGAVRASVRYPDMHELLLQLTQAITEGGSARGEWLHLIDALGVTLRNTEISADPADPERTANLAVGLLLTESSLLGTSKTLPLARRDARGLVRPLAGGPFVDTDSDGYADTDGLGRFVDAGGAPLAVPQPFQLPVGTDAMPWQFYDPEGKALASDGGPLLYEYVDVDKTVLAALSRDGAQLFDPGKGTAMDLARGASALLGPRVEATRTYDNGESLTYRGYDLQQAALLDMLFGYLQVLRMPGLDDVLALGRTLLVDHQPETARLAEAIIGAARTGNQHPEAQIDPAAPLWDDLMPLIRQVLANPTLVDALLRALERPEVKELSDRFADYMTYKDRFDIDPTTQAVTGAFTTEVDRTQIDNAFNRSLFQRLAMLINDSNHAEACNKQDAHIDQFGITVATYNECEFFQVDNLATFYLQSIVYAKDGSGNIVCEDAGGAFNPTQSRATAAECYAIGSGWRPRPKATFNYDWNQGLLSPGLVDTLGGDGYVEGQAGIEGMRTHPTPEALNRVLFLDPTPTFLANIIDPMRDKDGDLFTSQHAGTLPVWEKNGFYDQIRPILQAFADSNAEQLFVDIFATMHKHWPTPDSITTQTTDPNAPGYVWGSSGNTWEPLLADVMRQHTLLDTLVDIAPTLNAVTANGKNYKTIVRQAAAFVVNPLAGLADRHGNTTSTTSDGQAVATLSPWQILADAYVLKQARMAASGDEGVAWSDSISEVVDILLRAQDVPTVGWQFRNPRMRGVSVALIDFLRARVVHHDGVGDRTAWLSDDLPTRLEDLLSGPVFAGVADFILSLQAAPEARTQLLAMLQYLMDELGDPEAFDTSVIATADLLQLSVSDQDVAPFARLAGEALRPEKHWLDDQLTFLRAAREADENQALSTMVVNLFGETVPGRTAVGDVIDGISEVHRANPYQDLGKHYTADDYRSLFNGLADFLDEEQRGLRKFIGIIKGRNLP